MSAHDTRRYVKLADIEKQVNRLHDECRARDADRRAGLAEASAEYLEGFEDALNNVLAELDKLGWMEALS